jgi:glycerol-3-phosphate acyltransferase PlsY
MIELLGVVVAYLLGSVPFGLVLARAVLGFDPRTRGSKNIGATNVARTGGWMLGLITLALDVGKGAGGVALGRWLAGGSSAPWFELLVVAAPVLGHVYPVWLAFRGGKGVATALGALAVTDPLVLAVAAAVFVVLVVPTRIVSLGSIGAAIGAAGAALLLRGASGEAFGIVLAAALILWRHRENAARLIRGEESRLGRARGDGASGSET